MNEATPTKVVKALRGVLAPGEMSLAVIQTAWKPTATIPLLWLSLTNQRLLLFSTLRGGHVFMQARFDEINSIRAERESRTIEILFSNTEKPDMRFALSPTVSLDAISEFIAQTWSRIGRAT